MNQIMMCDYWGENKFGKPTRYDCSSFGEDDLVEMLLQPFHLPALPWAIGHRAWGRHVSSLFFQENGGVKAAAFGNLGFARGLSSLGFRVVPEPGEILWIDFDGSVKELNVSILLENPHIPDVIKNLVMTFAPA